jgi:hypothetical protein
VGEVVRPRRRRGLVTQQSRPGTAAVKLVGERDAVAPEGVHDVGEAAYPSVSGWIRRPGVSVGTPGARGAYVRNRVAESLPLSRDACRGVEAALRSPSSQGQ